MRFQYTEKKVNLPENVHKYAEKKVMKLERFFGDDAEALVTFSVDKDWNIAEITVHASNMYFRARESTSDMFASIDAAVATMERQIRKNKTRLAAVCGRTPLSARRMLPRLLPKSQRRVRLRSCARRNST